MKRVFVCSPFRGDVVRNRAVARAVCRDVLLAGDAPLAVHLVYPDLVEDEDPAMRALAIEAGIAWLARADEILVVEPPTEGMRIEIAVARALDIPVRSIASPNAEALRG